MRPGGRDPQRALTRGTTRSDRRPAHHPARGVGVLRAPAPRRCDGTRVGAVRHETSAMARALCAALSRDPAMDTRLCAARHETLDGGADQVSHAEGDTAA
ncbi:hypothetical protein GCM10020219_098710 [Nonomuraea dietziae]